MSKAYKIKYQRVGFKAWLLPSFYPDGMVIVIADDAEKAIANFYKDRDRETYEITDIRGVK